jgi:hypothetical protein
MQVTAELDNKPVEKLHTLKKMFNKNSSESIAFIIDAEIQYRLRKIACQHS